MHPVFSNGNRAVALPAWRTLKAIADAGQLQRGFSATEAFWRVAPDVMARVEPFERVTRLRWW
jgi:hypothetical protein